MLLFDESHNEFCTVRAVKKKKPYAVWKEHAEKYGLVTGVSQEEFTALLSEIKAIVVAEPHSYFTKEETFSLFDFVRGGGSLILVGNHSNTPRYFSYGCNEILNVFSVPFGVRFNNDEVFFSEGNTVETFFGHPVTKGVRRIHYWRGCSITVLRDAHPVAAGSKHDASDCYRKSPVVAAVYEGEGKIFCLGDSSVWADPREELDDNNFQFAENVIKWALG